MSDDDYIFWQEYSNVSLSRLNYGYYDQRSNLITVLVLQFIQQ